MLKIISYEYVLVADVLNINSVLHGVKEKIQAVK
jgi:hypothetical protein